MTRTTKTESLFDSGLTPYNTKERGYDYIDDVIYDLLNPNDSMKDILEFSRKFHCKLGTPSTSNIDWHFGLYMPANNLYDNNNKTK